MAFLGVSCAISKFVYGGLLEGEFVLYAYGVHPVHEAFDVSNVLTPSQGSNPCYLTAHYQGT